MFSYDGQELKRPVVIRVDEASWQAVLSHYEEMNDWTTLWPDSSSEKAAYQALLANIFEEIEGYDDRLEELNFHDGTFETVVDPSWSPLTFVEDYSPGDEKNQVWRPAPHAPGVSTEDGVD